MPIVPDVPNVIVIDTSGRDWEMTQRQYWKSTMVRRVCTAYSLLNPTPEQMGPPA